tara:strand:- start:162 stop:335 length:174 start_codon:yes stop_codon:yes gene_type:complete
LRYNNFIRYWLFNFWIAKPKKFRQATKKVDLAKILAKANWPTFMAFGPRQIFDTLSH